MNFNKNQLRIQQFGLTTTVKDDDGKEHYFYRGHEYVEIGGLKWAVTNVGAEKETDGGLYFAFGETQGYTAEQVRSGERKFNENEYTDTNFDSVNAYWGGKWRMPTTAEFRALLFLTTHKWVYNYQGSGVSGRLFTDNTDSSKKLFFPSAGCCLNCSVFYASSLGYYWSSSLRANNGTYGRHLYFSRGGCVSMDYNGRYLGFPIRGVIGD